ncbi:hypothetical protein PV326_006730 [Microctonus aethiopoides]|nr:hypothetical protein PV326_006730 [Microctonus aethiopoides]
MRSLKSKSLLDNDARVFTRVGAQPRTQQCVAAYISRLPTIFYYASCHIPECPNERNLQSHGVQCNTWEYFCLNSIESPANQGNKEESRDVCSAILRRGAIEKKTGRKRNKKKKEKHMDMPTTFPKCGQVFRGCIIQEVDLTSDSRAEREIKSLKGEEKEILSKGKKEKTSAAFSYRQSRPAPSLLLFSWSKPLAFCQGESTPHDREKTMRLRELRRSPLTYTHIHSTWLSGRRPGKRVSCVDTDRLRSRLVPSESKSRGDLQRRTECHHCIHHPSLLIDRLCDSSVLQSHEINSWIRLGDDESGHRLDSGSPFWRIQLDQDLLDTISAIYPEWFKDYKNTRASASTILSTSSISRASNVDLTTITNSSNIIENQTHRTTVKVDNKPKSKGKRLDGPRDRREKRQIKEVDRIITTFYYTPTELDSDRSSDTGSDKKISSKYPTSRRERTSDGSALTGRKFAAGVTDVTPTELREHKTNNMAEGNKSSPSKAEVDDSPLHNSMDRNKEFLQEQRRLFRNILIENTTPRSSHILPNLPF